MIRGAILALILVGMGAARDEAKPQALVARLKTVRLDQRDASPKYVFGMEYENRTGKPLVLFPGEEGRLLGIYTPVFISGADTIGVNPVSDVDFDCYPGDTIPAFGKIDREIEVRESSRIRRNAAGLKNMRELFAKAPEKAAIAFKLDIDFDTIGLHETDPAQREQLSGYRKCGKYYKGTFMTRFQEIERW